MMKNTSATATVFVLFFLLTSCAPVAQYHGVSENTWKTLTAEQKQAIVDQDFSKAMQDGDQNNVKP